jgi:hypothetical protein
MIYELIQPNAITDKKRHLHFQAGIVNVRSGPVCHLSASVDTFVEPSIYAVIDQLIYV